MRKGYFLVLATAVISGFSIFVNRFGVEVINPYIFTGLKNIFVAIFLLTILFLFKEWKKVKFLTKKDWLFLILIGLVGGSIPFLLFFKGLSLTTASYGSFLHKTMFIYVIIFSALILKEKISKDLILAGLLLIFGNILLLRFVPQSRFNYGNFLILIAVLLWSIEQIISKKAVMRISPRIVAWGRMFFGSIFIILFWLVTGQFSLIFDLNFIQIKWVLITSLFLLGYVLTWYTGIKYTPISKAVCVLTLGGPITALLDLIYGKVLSLTQVVGIVLIIFAVVLVLMSDWRKLIIFKIKEVKI